MPCSEHYEERVARHLVEHFPDARAMPLRRLLEGVRGQIARAEAYGFVTEQEIATYVTSAWLLGEDFDESFPSLGGLLRGAGPPGEKARRLSEQVAVLLSTLAGG